MDAEMQKKTPNFNSHARVGRDKIFDAVNVVASISTHTPV